MSSGTSQPIVFFGTEEYSLWVLQPLVKAGYSVVAVVTKPDTKKGRGHKFSEPAVKTYAIEHGITVWQPAKLTDIIDDIKAFDHPAAVLVAFGRIIP
jgi:methionyl-tRNA formyltransferase